MNGWNKSCISRSCNSVPHMQILFIFFPPSHFVPNKFFIFHRFCLWLNMICCAMPFHLSIKIIGFDTLLIENNLTLQLKNTRVTLVIFKNVKPIASCKLHKVIISIDKMKITCDSWTTKLKETKVTLSTKWVSVELINTINWH